MFVRSTRIDVWSKELLVIYWWTRPSRLSTAQFRSWRGRAMIFFDPKRFLSKRWSIYPAWIRTPKVTTPTKPSRGLKKQFDSWATYTYLSVETHQCHQVKWKHIVTVNPTASGTYACGRPGSQWVRVTSFTPRQTWHGEATLFPQSWLAKSLHAIFSCCPIANHFGVARWEVLITNQASCAWPV